MEECGETSDIFYLGAQTEWLPAEHFLNINNWDDSLKSSALYYIEQAEGWIASKKDATKNVELSKNVGCIITNSDNQKENEMTSKNQIGVDKQKRFECSQCGKSFAKNSHIIEHLRIHSGEKPFECSQCGMKFTQKSNLTTHLRIHSDKKLFSCNQCRKAFTL